MTSDYREERLALRKSINAQNKARGKAMERRVMKELRGSRVPMSGAGSIKGDGIVMHPSLGYIFVECKMSSGVNSKGLQKVAIPLKWFHKMDIEARIMNARFPILVIHHHDAKQDYVLLHLDHYRKYFLPPDAEVVCVKTINIGDKGLWVAIRQELEVVLAKYNDIMLLETRLGTYVICTLRYFKELLDGHE